MHQIYKSPGIHNENKTDKIGRYLQVGRVRSSFDRNESVPIMVYVAGSKKLWANRAIEVLIGFLFLAKFRYSLLSFIRSAFCKSCCKQIDISVKFAFRIGLRDIRMTFQPGNIFGSIGRSASRTNRLALFL